MESYHTLQKAVFKIDTDAQCNIIPKWKYQQVCKEPLQISTGNLVAFGGHKLNTSGKAHIQCTYKGHCYDIELEVIDQDIPNILGLHTCIEMNLVQHIDAVADDINEVFEKYSDVFNGLGGITNIQYHINIDQSHNPVVHPPRRFPVKLHPKSKRSSNVWSSSM